MTLRNMTKDSKSIVQSVGKAFRLMEAFGADENGYLLADLARSAELDNGTTFRLLNTFVLLGYVEKNEATRRFRLSLKCLNLGFNAIARTDLRSLARPHLRKLVGGAAEAASIGVLDENEVIYIERIQSSVARTVVDVRIGNRVMVHSSALGQAILSCMPETQQRAMLERQPLQKITPYTLTDVEQILERLRLVQESGYVLSDQENRMGLRVIAAPIKDIDGYAVAGLSAVAPAYGQTCEQFELDMRDPIIAAAAELSAAVQASGGTVDHSLII